MFEAFKNFISQLIKSRPAPHPVDGTLTEAAETVPLSDTQIETITRTRRRLEPPQLIACSGLSIGRERDHNEDSLFAFTANLAGDKETVNFGIFIIADGLGGHQQGEVASRVAIKSMAGYLIDKLHFSLFGLDAEKPLESVQEMMEEGVRLAHQAVQQHVTDGGTTMTAVMVLGRRMTIAHVGDSRAYAIHPDGRMELLTRDHSLAHRLEELGQITPEEAASHPKRHDLYRALGLDVSAEPDLTTAPIPQGGFLMVCSDGLWGVVPEADLCRLIINAPNLYHACSDLVEAANAAGGPDNISVVLVRMPD